VAAGDYHNLALRADGVVLAWGTSQYGATQVPHGLSRVTAIAASSASAVLAADGPPHVATPTLAATVYSGKLFEIRVHASGPGLLTYQWRFMGGDLAGETRPSLVLQDVRPEHSGDYQVVVANTLGAVVHQPLSLTIMDQAPLAVAGPTDQTAYRGQVADLEAEVDGSWPLHYQWYFNGQALDGATNAVLVFDPVGRDHSGSYHLVAANPFGTNATPAAQLRVDQVLGWGSLGDGQCTVPPGTTNVISIAASEAHSLAVLENGTVVGWGSNAYGQTSPPADLTNAVAVATGYSHSIALTRAGTVVGWGSVALGQSDIPPTATNVVAIASGRDFCTALRGDGRVVAWGYNDSGQTDVPATLDRVVAIACGMVHAVALRDNGTVIAWGVNAGGQIEVPPGLSDVIAVAAGGNHTLALRANGTVVAWGGINDFGENTVPSGLSGIVDIAAGSWHSLALRQDGTLVAWGRNWEGQASVPRGLRRVSALCGGWSHTLVVVDDRPSPGPVLTNPARASQFVLSLTAPSGKPYFLQQCTTLPTADWRVVTGGIGQGSPFIVADLSPAAPTAYYRVWTRP
jgi:alpha-tubulin suppressor-like RCC1 family protein